MPVNALAPEPRNAMLRPYEPSWKEQIAAYLMGNTRPSPERRQFAQGIADILGYLPGTGNVLQGQEAARAGDTKGAIMAMLPLPGANVAARAEQAIAQDVAKGIRAYHGSPHSFERFDISKIGTGEGNQAFGHGLYFADSEDVARAYRDKLSKGTMAINDQSFNPYRDLSSSNIAKAISENGLQGGIETAKKLLDAYHPNDPRVAGITDDLNKLLFAQRGVVGPNPGRMYEVNIKAKPEDFLDWDKPLSEQPHVLKKIDPRLRSQLENRLDRAGLAPNIEDYTGGEFHSMLTKHSNESDLAPGLQADPGQPEVAEYIRSLGIPGIRYQDAGSRGAANKTYNYVVNDDKLVEIMRKYGLMGPIGAGIAAKILARQEQRQDM